VKARRGLTLVELLIVMAIMAILAGAIAAVAIRGMGRGSLEAARADINKVSLALEQYHMTFRTYPPDTGYGLKMDIVRPVAKNGRDDDHDGFIDEAGEDPSTYDPGSLWRYLARPVYDTRTKRMHGPFLEWDLDKLASYNDPLFPGKPSFYLLDPWQNPYGFVGDPKRVIHNQGSFDLFSAGPDSVTACNNEVDDPPLGGTGPDGAGDPSDDPATTALNDNRAYNGKDDDGNGIIDDAPELGPEAMRNGDIADDVNNWSARD
jgi:prepilin-type N-terminal cleavage/methylation domain-containing protein